MWTNRGRRGPPQSVPKLEVLEKRNLLSAFTDLQTALANVTNDVKAIKADSGSGHIGQLGRDVAKLDADFNAALSLSVVQNSFGVVKDLVALESDGKTIGTGQEIMAFGSQILALAPAFGPGAPVVGLVGGGVVAFGGLEVSFGLGGALVDFQNLQADATLVLQKLQPPPPPPPPVNHDPDHDVDVDMY